MKKIKITTWWVIGISLLIFPFFVRAWLPVPGITPDSIFYSLDNLGEKIVLFFTFSTEKKIDRALEYAGEKLAEIKAMSEQNKPYFIKRASENYQRYLKLANKKSQKIESEKDKEAQIKKIGDTILNYQKILLDIYKETATDCKSSIEEVLGVSKEEFESAIKTLSETEKETLEQEQEEIDSSFEQIKSEIFEEKEPQATPPATPTPMSEKETIETPSPSLFSEEERLAFNECKAIEFSDIFEIVKCYKELGRKFQNLELCNQATEISGIGSCYGGKGAATGNYTLCNQFSRISSESAFTILTSTCYGAMAQITGDDKICASAPTFKSRVGCYLLVAGLKKDINVCMNITQGREGCYILVASEKKDLTVCDKITESQWKNLCVLSVRNEISGKTELCKVGAALGLFTEEDCLRELLKK